MFFGDVVRPLLERAYSGLPYAAARIGPGSEVLGFDTERSMDHDWGPRLELFLTAEDVVRLGDEISALLTQRLPTQFRGLSTHFGPAGRVRVMTPTDGLVAHAVAITDIGTWCTENLGFDPRSGVTALDWLATPGQRLAEATGGAVFLDGVGEVSAVRRTLSWYPDDVWRYLLACQWQRISEEEPFVGRAAEVGDELGSRVVAARMVRELMRLCLLLGRTYPPYSKWLGSAFRALPHIDGIAATLDDAMSADGSSNRQSALCRAYEAVGEWQNRLRLAEPVDATRRLFFDRPFQVIGAGRFADALLARVEDPDLAALPAAGAVDQLADSTEVLSRPHLARAVMAGIWASRGIGSID
jgi:hypothetical protein